jgi:hypothetical protein
MADDTPRQDRAGWWFVEMYAFGAILHGYEVMTSAGIQAALGWGIAGGLLALAGWHWQKIKLLLGPRFDETARRVTTDFRWWVLSAITLFIISMAPSWIDLSHVIYSQVAGDYFRHVPRQVVDAFNSISDARLGNQSGDIESTPVFAYGQYDNATVLWFKPDENLIFLPSENKEKVISYRGYVPGYDDPRTFDDNFARTITGTPRDKCPPLGGLANLWQQNKKKWEWIGYRVFQYHYDRDEVFVQRFQHGMKIGPVPVSRTGTDGQIVVVPRDNEFQWYHQTLLSAPKWGWSAPFPCIARANRPADLPVLLRDALPIPQ